MVIKRLYALTASGVLLTLGLTTIWWRSSHLSGEPRPPSNSEQGIGHLLYPPAESRSLAVVDIGADPVMVAEPAVFAKTRAPEAQAWLPPPTVTDQASLPTTTVASIGGASLPQFGQDMAMASVPLFGVDTPVNPQTERGVLVDAAKKLFGDRPMSLEDWQRVVASLPANTARNVHIPLGAGHYVMGLCQDQNGLLWVSTEGEGVFRYDPTKGPDGWKQFTEKDGLGDDVVYAIACDKQGRIFIGHLNHGVSVYNGKSWQNYQVVGGLLGSKSLSGPLGERVFRITVAPNGDVWMATNAGIARYFPDTNSWSYLTRACGLPSDQISSMAFAADGKVYLGTQTDGILVGNVGDGFATWKQIKAPQELPLAPKGWGLPSGLINDVLVGTDGTVYAATTAGVAWTLDKGQTWQFVRGANWAEKVRQRIAGSPVGWTPQPGAILSEDYCTALAEDAQGNIHVGHRATVGDILSPKAGAVVRTVPAAYVTTLLSLKGGNGVLRGTYNSGLSLSRDAQDNRVVVHRRSDSPGDFPAAARSPSSQTLGDLADKLRSLASPSTADVAAVVPVVADWTTQGTWLGRLGRFFMVHGACVPNGDIYWGPFAQEVGEYDVQLGPGAPADDYLRYWVAANYTKDVRSLELNSWYLSSRVAQHLTDWSVDRRQTEWDDHGETMSMARQGPGLFCSLNVPDGLFYLSFYNVNDDGKINNNRLRDYVYFVREHPANLQLDRYDGFFTWPELARARVVNYWGGVYTRFLVHGPRKLTVYLDRNYSFNTNFNGFFLDSLDEFPQPYYDWGMVRSDWRRGITNDADPGIAVFEALDTLKMQNPASFAAVSQDAYVTLLRWYVNGVRGESLPPESAYCQIACLNQLHLFEASDKLQREKALTTSRDLEKSLRWDGKINALHGKLDFNLIVTSQINQGARTGMVPSSSAGAGGGQQ